MLTTIKEIKQYAERNHYNIKVVLLTNGNAYQTVDIDELSNDLKFVDYRIVQESGQDILLVEI